MSMAMDMAMGTASPSGTPSTTLTTNHSTTGTPSTTTITPLPNPFATPDPKKFSAFFNQQGPPTLPPVPTPKPEAPKRWFPRDPTRALTFGLVSPKDMIAAQDEANRVRDLKMSESSVAKFTPRMAWIDAGQALYGIPRDLARGKSLREAFVSNDRLRGLGVLLVAIAVIGLALTA